MAAFLLDIAAINPETFEELRAVSKTWYHSAETFWVAAAETGAFWFAAPLSLRFRQIKQEGRSPFKQLEVSKSLYFGSFGLPVFPVLRIPEARAANCVGASVERITLSFVENQHVFA